MLVCTPFPAGRTLGKTWETSAAEGERTLSKKEARQVDVIYPHGDVDDMIYQEEWSASTR